MANFKDISGLISGEHEGGKMSESMNLPSEVKEKAISLLDEARDMLDKEGVDGTRFIVSHLTGERAAVESGDTSDKKSIIIEVMKRRISE